MKRKNRKPTITLWAFWELTKKQQQAVRVFMEREPHPHCREYEEYNYTVTEPGAVDWLDIKTIRLED